jgi:hypothetical protein
MRLDDDITADVDALAAMSEEELFAASAPVGGALAPPGTTASGLVELRPGEYVAICFLPVGATPENMAAIESGQHDAPAHYAAGMIHLLTVT